MFNLLPEKEKKLIRRQYRMRKMIVLFAIITFVAFSSVIFLVPSYILTIFKVEETQLQIDIVQKALNDKDQVDLEAQVKDLNQRIQQVSLDQKKLQFYDVLQKLFTTKPTGVSVTGFLIQDDGLNKKQLYKIQVTGVSATRNALVSYRDMLEQSGLYDEVDLPIESLASQFDTEFTLNLVLSL